MTATRTRKAVTTTRIEIGPRHTAHVYGGDKMWAQTIAAHIPHARCPWCRALIVPADRAQDLATHLELRGVPVTLSAFLL